MMAYLYTLTPPPPKKKDTQKKMGIKTLVFQHFFGAVRNDNGNLFIVLA